MLIERNFVVIDERYTELAVRTLRDAFVGAAGAARP
jgi:hypothetical protein